MTAPATERMPPAARTTMKGSGNAALVAVTAAVAPLSVRAPALASTPMPAATVATRCSRLRSPAVASTSEPMLTAAVVPPGVLREKVAARLGD